MPIGMDGLWGSFNRSMRQTSSLTLICLLANIVANQPSMCTAIRRSLSHNLVSIMLYWLTPWRRRRPNNLVHVAIRTLGSKIPNFSEEGQILYWRDQNLLYILGQVTRQTDQWIDGSMNGWTDRQRRIDYRHIDRRRQIDINRSLSPFPSG